MIAVPVKADRENLMNSQVSKLFFKTEEVLLVSENGTQIIALHFDYVCL